MAASPRVYIGWLCALVVGAGAARCGETAAARDRQPLAAVDARPERRPPSKYEITRGSCADRTCAVIVSLVADGRVLDTAALDWRIPEDSLTRAPADATSGIGDPAAAAADSGWNAGSEESAVSMFLRPVTLAPGLRGVLVAQSAGFDHVKRRHYVFATVDDRLTAAWDAVEPNGPYASTVAVVPRADGTDRLLRFLEFRSPEAGVADTLRLRAYVWNAGGGRMVEEPLADTLAAPRAVVLGPFATVDVARRARSDHEACLASFLALPASGAPQAKMPTGATMLALMTTSAARADSVRAAVAACVKSPTPVVTWWRPAA